MTKLRTAEGAMIEILAQYGFNGLILGANYALIGIGLTMIFGIMNIANFAHGQFYMLGGFFAYMLVARMGLHYLVALPLAVLAVAAVGWVLERVIFARLRDRSSMTAVLATIGLAILLESGALLTWGPQPEALPTPFSPLPLQLGPLFMTWARLFVLGVTVAALCGLYVFLNHSAAGTALRATFQNRDAAALVGINVDRLYSVTFALGAGLAALGGVLLGSLFLVHPTMGEVATMKAFIVVILGGLGSVFGSAVGGLILGLAESFGTMYSSAWKDGIGFLLVILILLYRPDGLFKR
jgi:branched-chain amino acid transport system permease protein